MRIAIGQVSHESNTFSNVKTTVQSFKNYEWIHGEEVLKKHSGVRNYLGGMIDQGKANGIHIVPTFSAYSSPSGTITGQAFERLKDELVSSLQRAGQVDAICLALHGAGVAEGVNDLEGELLKALRRVVGYDIPIVVTLDLHGNLTQTMVNEANALLGVHFYPHTDTYDRGREAIQLAEKIVQGHVNPAMSLVKLPFLIFFSTTFEQPEITINNLCWDWEKEAEVMDCTFFHGFVRSDIPDAGASVLAVTDNNPLLAKQVAQNVAQQVWNLRERFIREYPSPDEGIQQALATEGYPIVINETSDNPGSGAPGDGTYLLNKMIEKNVPKSCFGFVYDPEVAELAHRAGVGSTVCVELGGKTDSMHGNPLSIQAYVKSLTDGKFVQSSPMSQGAQVNLGKSVRLQVGKVDIIVCSVKSQTFDEQVFLLHGIDVTEYKIVALKSCQHFRAAFQPIAKKIITVDSPGLSTSNPSHFDYKYIQRPIYPLDRDCQLTFA